MSRFAAQTGSREGFQCFRIIDRQYRSMAEVVPELGNNCVRFRTSPDSNGRGAPVDVFVPPAKLSDLKVNPFQAGQPILFPFPNRVRDGAYEFEGRHHRMEALLKTGWDKGAGQAIHGLVANKAWTIEKHWADEETAGLTSFIRLDSFPDIYEQYPFRCTLRVTYTLHDGRLEMSIRVDNHGECSLPMGFGIHPWFPTSLREGVEISAGLEHTPPVQRARARACVPARAVWELDRLMPTGAKIPVSADPEGLDLRGYSPLQDRFFDHVFTDVERGADGWSTAGLWDTDSGLEMFVMADAQFREWVLYAPRERPVIALEPYTCATDAVNLQRKGIDAGLIALGAGQEWRGNIAFGIRRRPAPA